ncbi:MAG: hypothetical protein GY715_14845 [Planctomycetes bacterium]|nr:hypothetical protein [Planctomycetota bacterium]
MRCVRSRLALVAAALFLTSPAWAVDCQVRQLDWLDDDVGVLIPFSRVGEIVFTFDPADPEDQILFNLGYVNVLLNDNFWVVQNLPLLYLSPEHMSLSQPSVQFGLPIENGVPFEQAFVNVTITPEPLDFPPFGTSVFKPVFPFPYHAGGFEGGGSSLSDIPFVIGSWVGPFIPILPTDIAFTDLEHPIRAVDEEKNGCAPASAARSIQYMGDVAGFATGTAQEIYGDLKDDMGTSVGPGSTGTSVGDFLTGKDEYVDENNLPIDTVQTFGMADICDAADAINDGGDVEIMIAWSGGGGHAAMIKSIIKWPDGSATITYVDDPTQGDGTAANEEHVIHVNPDGTFDGGSIIGFQIETIDKCPADLNGDGSVGFGDILQIIGAWGDCPGPGSCEEDLDGDGSVGFSDILEVIGNWGDCPEE